MTMMMNVAFASGGYSCVCVPPLKQLLSFNLVPHRRPPHFLFFPSHKLNFPKLNLIFSANPLLFGMQGGSYPLVWACCILLAISVAVHCIQFWGSISCPETLGSESYTISSPNMGVILSGKSFLSGSGISKNKAMVENLKRYGVISSNKVAEVMETIDRALFVPEGTTPYADSPKPIGYNATISAPHMHATCLQLLEKHLHPGMRALDVGSGTGYLTACFALMVGPQGRAVGVEHIPELVAESIKSIERSAAAPLLKEGSLSVQVGDGRLGWPECAPYDAIHVGAAADKIPKPLIDQLKPGGRMVIPVGDIFQDLQVVDKNLDGSVRVYTETSVRYVPLTSIDEQLSGF